MSEPSTFWGNRVKLESESLKLPTALSYEAAYFSILAVYLKNQWEPCLKKVPSPASVVYSVLLRV